MLAINAKSPADWNFLRSTNCDLVQGYFIARAMPGDEVAGWIAGWAERFKILNRGAPVGRHDDCLPGRETFDGRGDRRIT
jgi:hypothetical protein